MVFSIPSASVLGVNIVTPIRIPSTKELYFKIKNNGWPNGYFPITFLINYYQNDTNNAGMLILYKDHKEWKAKALTGYNSSFAIFYFKTDAIDTGCDEIIIESTGAYCTVSCLSGTFNGNTTDRIVRDASQSHDGMTRVTVSN